MVKALDRKLFRDLWHQRGHVIAIAVVVACGVSAFVMMMGVERALDRSRAAYYERNRFADVFARVRRAPESLIEPARRLAGVAQVESRIALEASAEVRGFDEPIRLRLTSIPDDRTGMMNALHLRAGRWPQPRSAREILVGEAFAAAHRLRSGDLIRAVVNGRWQSFEITGIAISPEFVFETWGATAFPDNLRFGIAWIGRDALATAADLDGAFNDLLLRLAPGANESAVIRKLDELLAPYGTLGAHGRDLQISARLLADELAQDRVTATTIPIVFLAVAAFLIHNVLLRIIAMQRAQIGVLKAFGYADVAIILHLVKFSMVAVLIGIVVGLGAGAWLGRGLARLYVEFFHFPQLAFDIDLRLFAGVVMLGLVTGFVGAVFSARRAAQLAPAESMRPRAPESYRALLLEQLGLARWLSPSGRMILRHLERHPLKSLGNLIAVAMAISLLVVGQYSFDALDELVRLQFREAQREDIDVGFREPVALDQMRGLAVLPGVLRVEPYRLLPVKLRNAHRERRVAVTAVFDDGQMRRPLDREGRRVVVDEYGLTASRALLDVLGLRQGDRVELEVTDGLRHRAFVPVSGVVDDYIGLSVYASPAMLARLAGDSGLVSGALLRVDDSRRADLLARLRAMPQVVGIAQREAILKSFLEIVARNITMSMFVLVVFAAAIAAGLVYNGVSLALSEQSLELASLRVLGFTQWEVGWILLGEQALLCVLAMPCGMLMGYGLSAWIAALVDGETYRLPLTIGAHSYAVSAVVVALAAAVSGALVLLRLRRMDLVEALKTRE